MIGRATAATCFCVLVNPWNLGSWLHFVCSFFVSTYSMEPYPGTKHSFLRVLKFFLANFFPKWKCKFGWTISFGSPFTYLSNLSFSQKLDTEHNFYKWMITRFALNISLSTCIKLSHLKTCTFRERTHFSSNLLFNSPSLTSHILLF